MSDTDALTECLETAVFHPTRASDMEALQSNVLGEIENGSLPLKRTANKLLTAAFQSRHRASDLALRGLVEALTKQSIEFATVFTTILANRYKQTTHAFASVRLVVMQLTCTLVKTAIAQDASQMNAAWVPTLANLQSKIMEAALYDVERMQTGARKSLLQLLQAHPDLIPIYSNVIIQCDDKEQTHYQLWTVLSALSKVDAATMESIWSKYAFWAFESKSKATVVAAFDRHDVRFRGLDAATFDTAIKPTMSKALKKSPDSILDATRAFVKGSSIDFGQYLDEIFLSLLTSKLRAQKDDVRHACLFLAKELVQSFTDVEPLSKLVSSMAQLLEGKHGILAQFYQREAAFAVLLFSAEKAKSFLSVSDAENVAKDAVAALLKAVKKEAHDQTRHLGQMALGTWMAVGQVVSDECASAIKSGLGNSSEPVVAGYLRTLVVYCQVSESIGVAYADKAGVFTTEIVKVIQDSNKKVNIAHLDGVLAIALAGMLSLSSSAIGAQMTQDKVADIILDSSSFVDNSVSTVLQTAATQSKQNNSIFGVETTEMTAVAALPSALTWVLSSDQTDATAAHKLLIELLVSSVASARESSANAISSMYASTLVHCPGLVTAFERKLVNVAIAQEKQTANANPSDDPPASLVPQPGTLRRALRVLVPSSLREEESVRDLVLPLALFIAHHPFLVDNKRSDGYAREWKRTQLQFITPVTSDEVKKMKEEDDIVETNEDRVDHLFESSETLYASVLDLLADGQTGKLFSKVQVDRIAAQRVVATMLQFAGLGEGERLALNDVIEKRVIERLSNENISSISDDDVDVFYTPDDVLRAVEKNNGAANGSSKSSRRGTKEEQWEQEVREELERKKAQKGSKTTTYSKEEKALLAQQQQRRVELRETVHIVSSVREMVEMLATTSPEELHPTLPYLLQSVRPLFECRLFPQTSADMLRSMSKAVSPALLRDDYEDISSSLRVALELEQMDSKKDVLESMNNLFSRTLASLMDHVFGFQFASEGDYDVEAPCNRLHPPTFHLVFPMLRIIALYEPSLRKWALPLIAAHAAMIPQEEEEEVGDVDAQFLLRKPIIELSLQVLQQLENDETVPIANPGLFPSQILAQTCKGAELSSEQWKLLLSDDGLLSESEDTRMACLSALYEVVEDPESSFETHKTDETLAARLYYCCFDCDEGNRETAKEICESSGCQLPASYAETLLPLLNHMHASVRECAALTIADGMRQYPESVSSVLSKLQEQFESKVPKPSDMLDEFGIPKIRRPGDGEDVEAKESYLPRCGVALCLEKAAKTASLSSEKVKEVLGFIVDIGLPDPHAEVRGQIRKSGVQIIDKFGGGDNTMPLLQMLEKVLDETPTSDGKSTQDVSKNDRQREGVVVFLGALAKHMDKTDPKVSSIVDSLVESLNIPSESVQRSVANCLSPLMPAVKERSPDILEDLLKRATTGETFGERMGGAYGVSAVVKGLGISALKQQSVIPRLEEGMKSGANGRQGGMLVFECLSKRLGILFEPYIIVILPIMLKCVADSSSQVREAANHTAQGIMANLSGHGVKLVLPSLLKSLDDSAWRTKQAGIRLLGSMAYCAPKQLGTSLPQVVPTLTESLADSHPKVREAAKKSLRDIGSVIRNPEVASISHVLLNALEDPNKHNADALHHLQSTSFVHAIDAPSLALVMPTITRGLKDRTGDAKKKSALIVGSMCSMINDPKDLVPYMDMVLPSLQGQLMDPIPEVRAVAAKAMGNLVKGLGEKHFSDILSWLLDAIKDDTGSVERSGAAQGLCEVLVALGGDRVESTVANDVLPLARHPDYPVREGVLWVIAFLPPALGKSFSIFLKEALPIIVSGLSDEVESVRDVAMHAGHVVVNAHAVSHTRDILPSLEQGLFDDSWRIRQSSVTLLGDLMYRISGTRSTGTGEGDEDDAAGSAAGDRAIIKILGMQRRNTILSALYMIRSDTSAVVRQSALQVWKSVVVNTPKTLRQILRTLMDAIIGALSGDSVEKQTMASRTLGEIVRKLGEQVLLEIVPILRAGLSEHNPSGTRQGVCLGLAEVIECSTKKQLEDFIETLVEAMLDGLCDDLPEVRSSAAQAFDSLHKGVGYRAIDETIPSLLQRVNDASNVEQQSRALNGVHEILRVKSREVLPYIVPRLLVTPLSKTSVRALGKVAQATGATIHFQIEKIFGTLVAEQIKMHDAGDEETADEIKSTLQDIVLSVEDPGIHWLVFELCKYCESESSQERALALSLVAEFCRKTQASYKDQVAMLLKQILRHMNDSDESVVKASSDALSAMNVSIRPELFVQHLSFIRQTINSVVSDAKHRKGGAAGSTDFQLPALCIPKGLEPFLPVYQHALMHGSTDQREDAAAGLGELVLVSSPTMLRPYLIKLTGPLIRIAGDRFPGHVKSAILSTLEILLSKGGVALKPFLPQLQTTFVKALNDNATEVRAHGASALSKLVTLSPRIDPLVAELTEKLKTTTGGIRDANLEAIGSVVEAVGDKLSSTVKNNLEEALEALLEATEDKVRYPSSRSLALLVVSDAEEGASKTLKYGLVNHSDLASLPWTRRQSACTFLELVLKKEPSWLSDISADLSKGLFQLAEDDKMDVRSSAMQAVGAFVKHQGTFVTTFVPVLATNIASSNKEVARGSLKITKQLAKRDPESMRQYLPALVPVTFQLIKGGNVGVKLTAERALLYLLEIHTRSETLNEYVKSTSPQDGKIISEYARRVLTKLKTDSDDEE